MFNYIQNIPTNFLSGESLIFLIISCFSFIIFNSYSKSYDSDNTKTDLYISDTTINSVINNQSSITHITKPIYTTNKTNKRDTHLLNNNQQINLESPFFQPKTNPHLNQNVIGGFLREQSNNSNQFQNQ